MLPRGGTKLKIRLPPSTGLVTGISRVYSLRTPVQTSWSWPSFVLPGTGLPQFHESKNASNVVWPYCSHIGKGYVVWHVGSACIATFSPVSVLLSADGARRTM